MKKTEDNKKTEQTKTPQSSSKCKEELIEEAPKTFFKQKQTGRTRPVFSF